MDIHTSIGAVAVTLYFVGSIPYFKDILYGTTRPNRVTWFGWAALAWTSAIIQSTHGADASVMIVYASATLLTLIFGFSLYRGVTTFSVTDGISLALGGTTFIVWLFLDNPAIALIVNIIADFLFGVPTIIKAWQEPRTESKVSWFFGFLSTGLALTAKTKFDFINTAFPLYLFFINTLIFIFTTGYTQHYALKWKNKKSC